MYARDGLPTSGNDGQDNIVFFREQNETRQATMDDNLGHIFLLMAQGNTDIPAFAASFFSGSAGNRNRSDKIKARGMAQPDFWVHGGPKHIVNPPPPPTDPGGSGHPSGGDDGRHGRSGNDDHMRSRGARGNSRSRDGAGDTRAPLTTPTTTSGSGSGTIFFLLAAAGAFAYYWFVWRKHHGAKAAGHSEHHSEHHAEHK
jgi:hypothetical protein